MVKKMSEPFFLNFVLNYRELLNPQNFFLKFNIFLKFSGYKSKTYDLIIPKLVECRTMFFILST